MFQVVDLANRLLVLHFITSELVVLFFQLGILIIYPFNFVNQLFDFTLHVLLVNIELVDLYLRLILSLGLLVDLVG